MHLSRLIGVRLNHADGFLLREFRQLADAENQRVRQPLRRRHPQLTLAGRRAGSDGDLERDGFGQDGTGEPPGIEEEKLHPGIDYFFPDGGRHGLLLQRLHTVSQLGGLHGIHGPGVIDDRGSNAASGNIRRGDVGQILSAGCDLEGGALPAAGRQDIREVRGVLRQHGRDGRQKSGQPACWERHMISFRRPPILMPSARVGVIRTSSPWELGIFASGSMPNNS